MSTFSDDYAASFIVPEADLSASSEVGGIRDVISLGSRIWYIEVSYCI